MNGVPGQFCVDYANQRATEGYGYSGAALRALPYLRSGPFARQWAVRARSFEALARHVLGPRAQTRGRPLDMLDLGAGNGWLCHRVAGMGHRAIALDMRHDAVDGLGAAAGYLRDTPGLFERIVAYFDALPFGANCFDITLFNASLHYAQDLAHTVAEAARVTRPGGTLVILDSPFYASDADGAAMIAEKRAQAASRFGERAESLLSPHFIEYLTAERLAAASSAIGLRWSRTAVRYPLWYAARPLLAKLKGARRPSRFDLWTAEMPAAPD
jgi:SAM-dependent methyltransferase